MKKYQIVTHRRAKEFIESLDKARRARVDRIYYIFEEYGTHLPRKFLKKVTTEIWELRPGDVRLFLTIKGNTGFVVHGIFKKTRKLRRGDLKLAKQRIKEGVEKDEK